MKFCNIDFNIPDRETLFLRNENETKCIVTANAQLIHFGNTIERYFNFMNSNDVCFDGTIPLKVARMKNKNFKKFEKLSGSEIIYDFCNYAKDNDLRMFLLGGKEISNTESVKILRENYNINIDGYSPKYEEYPFSEEFIKDCFDKLEIFRPDILFIGFGSPKQEFFIQDSKQFFNKIGIKYVVGCGGTFEFVSGKIKRAPVLIQKIGLESIYRLIMEPSRMRIKRILQSFKFLRFVKNAPNFS